MLSAVQLCCLRHCCVVSSTVLLSAILLHVDDSFAAGRKSRYDQMCDELNMLVTINNLGDLTWYGRCHYSRDTKRGLRTISQQAFTKRSVEKYSHGSSISISASPGIKLEDFDPTEPKEDLLKG